MQDNIRSVMALPVQYFQQLVESCPDIIISVDKKGTITFYNDGARENLGFSGEEVLGKNVLTIYPTIEEARRVMAAMRAGTGEAHGRVRNFETVFKTKRGEKIPVAISASVTYDEHGNESGSIGFAKDIREIRRRDQLVTLAELAIGLSHEINNSLEVVVNHIDMLRQYVGRAASDEDYLVESERLDSLASQVEKIQDITGRISQMADEGEYGTREYLNGKMMTDLHVESTASRCERLKATERYPLSGLRVLIVDDDAGVCDSLRELLQGERCMVETASSGVKAIALLDKESFDLVLSDVVMPDMDGYELYQAVKRKTPDMPVVLMTAFNYDKDHIIKRSCLQGLQGVIFKKPVNPAMLKRILLQQCRPPDSADTPAPMAAVTSSPNARLRRE